MDIGAGGLRQLENHPHFVVSLFNFFEFGGAFARYHKTTHQNDAGYYCPQHGTVGLLDRQEHKATNKNNPHHQSDQAAGIEMHNLLCAPEITVNEERSHINTEAGDQAQGIHIGEDPLFTFGNENDGREKKGIQEMDAVEGMPSVSGYEPKAFCFLPVSHQAAQMRLLQPLDLSDILGLAQHDQDIAILYHKVRRWNQNEVLWNQFLYGYDLHIVLGPQV